MEKYKIYTHIQGEFATLAVGAETTLSNGDKIRLCGVRKPEAKCEEGGTCFYMILNTGLSSKKIVSSETPVKKNTI